VILKRTLNIKSTKHSILFNIAHFILVGIVVAIAEATREHLLANAVSGAILAIAAVQIICLYLLISANRRLEEIAPRIGIRTMLMNFPEAYVEAEKKVRNAKEEILIVSNWSLPYQPKPGAESNRKRYFSAALEKAKAGGITYERIAQLPRSEKGMMKSFPLLAPHLRECIEARDHKQGKIGIFISDPSTLVSFLLVDSSFVLFQLDEFDYSSGCFQVSKALILEDNTGEVASAFKEIYATLKLRSRAMELGDLAHFTDGSRTDTATS